MATKILYYGDPHARGTNPRNRTDNYFEAFRRKHMEIFRLAEEHEVDAIVQPGDTFHTPDVANSVLNATADILAQSPVPIYTTVGNHDIPGYNIEAYANTSLYLLQRLVPQLHVLLDPSDGIFIGRDIVLTATPYSRHIDEDGFGYSPETPLGGSRARVHLAHGMLLDHDPPFDKFTRIKDVKTTADIVLTGHDHTGYGIYNRYDGVVFINPGALMRLEASLGEIRRPVQVALISAAWTSAGIAIGSQLIPLESAAPGEEILDRSKIEADHARQYAMNSFAALIKSSSGEVVKVDINQIVDTIAKEEQIPEAVVKKALDKIEEARIAGKGVNE